jgi:hyaluronoglucosaminidase
MNTPPVFDGEYEQFAEDSTGLEALLPRPRELSITGSAVPMTSGAVISGSSAGSEAWILLADLRPEQLPPGGYVLRVGPHGVVIAAADEDGEFHAAATARQLEVLARTRGGRIEQLDIRDWPTLPWRGVIEGFYGRPWSHQDRLDTLSFCGRFKLNSYAYAPKDDPYHREKWREPYPARELAALGELVETARQNRVRFVYTLAPGLSMRYSDEAEYEALYAKAEQLVGVGVRSIALLFDDLDPELADAADRAMFGTEPGSAGAAHGTVCARFQEEFLRPRVITEPLVMVPTDYAGVETTPYRVRLAETLPADALVWWTGADIVVGDITREHIDAARASYRRDLVLWDNFPVNDFDSTRLFLGPLHGRTTAVAGSALVGISANPMVEAAASRLALASVADWAWNTGAYEEAGSAARAIYWTTGSPTPAIQPLIDAASSWPPSAPQHPRVIALIEAALAGDPEAVDGLERELLALAVLPRTTEATPARLREDLLPWIDAAGHAAAAALLATELLRAVQLGRALNVESAEPTQGGHEQIRRVEAAQAIADADVPSVLRTVLPDYVRRVLDRARGVTTAHPTDSPTD